MSEQIFTSTADCGLCLESVLAINLELVSLDFGKFWACDGCRKDLKDAQVVKKDIDLREAVLKG